MGAETVDWTDLREFRATGLTDSFVLSWRLEGEALQIDLDLLLYPGHAFYEKPRPAERVCIRPALLEFPFCAELIGGSIGGGEPSTVVAGLGSGRIGGMRLTADGQYEIKGEFGTVVVHAERPLLRLKAPGM